MGKLSNQTTFNGDVYSVLSIPSKRQDGITPQRIIHINESKTKIVVASESGGVLATISSENCSPLTVEILD